MKMFSCRSDAVGELGLFSNRKRHSLDDNKEEDVIDPVEEEDEEIKPEGAKRPAENNASGEWYYGPRSLI